ncbi:MAG TPA: DUF2167 domain-containing protein [Burkholderiales bacterium]
MTRSLCALLCVLAAALPVASRGQDPQEEIRAALEAAQKAQVAGPSEVKLLDQAVLKLPAGHVYFPPAEAGRLLQAMGNRTGDDLLGAIFPDRFNWFIVMRQVKSGYVKDDDARDWNSDELLQSLKKGTAASNQDRRSRHIPEIEVIGWVEPPAYDAGTHRLVWSAQSRELGEPDGAERGVNYNTYALGRDGYISMNLVTGMNSIEAQKPVARQMLAALEYNPGKRYADFDSSTDRVAEFGLLALIGGVAAKKLGLLALIAAFAVKFAKVIGIAVLGLAAVAAKLLRRRPPA